RIGATLRKHKLDELPQLFNVLRGEMSIVGPRPEVPEYVDWQAPIWQDVLEVRPGITDFATLLYRNEEELLGLARDPEFLYRNYILPSKLRLNLHYLRARSLTRDFTLIWHTIRFSIFPKQFDPDLVQRSIGNGVGDDTKVY